MPSGFDDVPGTASLLFLQPAERKSKYFASIVLIRARAYLDFAVGDSGDKSEQSWSDYARLPLPPEHPIVRELQKPREVIYPGLGVVDWHLYFSTLNEPDRLDRIKEASKTLFITNQRLIVVDFIDPDRPVFPIGTTSVPLEDIDDVDLVKPPGKPIAFGEMMIQLLFHAEGHQRLAGWTTRRADAKLFIEMLNGFRGITTG